MNDIQELKQLLASLSRGINAAMNTLETSLSLAAPAIERKIAELEQKVNQLQQELDKERNKNAEG